MYNKGSVITIGNFDGVHLGHQTILKKLVDISKKENLKSIVISFDLSINKTDLLLSTEQEKIELLSDFALDEILILKVDKKLISTSADEFFENILIEQLNVKHIVVGYDAAFGKDREGSRVRGQRNVCFSLLFLLTGFGSCFYAMHGI